MNTNANVRNVGRYVYAVRSASNPGAWHTVDLTANGGAGVCSCVDHGTRRQPAIDRGEPALTAPTTCRHVRAALWQFMREVLPRLAADESNPHRNKRTR
jgi:hypothetical protein